MDSGTSALNRVFRSWQHAVAAATSLCLAASAQATVYVEARSSSFSQASPHGVSSFALAQNGLVPAGGGNAAGPNGTSSAGPIGTGVTTAFANTSQIDGPVLTDSMVTADLSKGSIGVLINAGGGQDIGASVAIGIGRWIETITFNNSNPNPVELDIFWDTDGSVVDQSGPNFGSIDIESSVELATVNDANFKDVHFKGAPASFLGGAQFVYSGASGARFTFKPAGNNDFGIWTTTIMGNFSGLLKATLVVPSGVVSITITSFLSIDARTGAVVDYTEGATFHFGDLPNGLTWTSESGVFLGNTNSGGADSDGDGTPNVSDGCPNDPQKTAAGQCGCGVTDVDTDGDGVCDAVDNCPDAANADQADADGDGTGDACEPPPAGNGDGGDGSSNGGGSDDVGPPPAVSTCAPVSSLTLAPIALGLLFMRRRYSRWT